VCRLHAHDGNLVWHASRPWHRRSDTGLECVEFDGTNR
jgi:hypothetical protein